MGIETESEQTYEPILNVGDWNIEESERSEQFLIEASGPGDEGISSQDDASMQPLVGKTRQNSCCIDYKRGRGFDYIESV
jgi:hypothetical protein